MDTSRSVLAWAKNLAWQTVSTVSTIVPCVYTHSTRVDVEI
jgi:hypothetical protein